VESCIDSPSVQCNLIPHHEEESETAVPTPTPPPLLEDGYPSFILIRSANLKRCIELKLQLKTINSRQPFSAKALLDSGATNLFIDDAFVKLIKLKRTRLPRSILLYNIDGTLNEHGSIKESVDLVVRYQDHTERAISLTLVELS